MIGIGFDIHRTVKGRPLILGGVRIESDFGLLGHSDADVLTHAVIDALLGALGMGDIGEMFPDTDPVYKDKDSIEMLLHVVTLMKEQNRTVQHLDCNIIAQKPKLKDNKDEIKACLAQALELELNCVNVKAKTHEEVGPLGRCEAISAQAVVLLKDLGERRQWQR